MTWLEAARRVVDRRQAEKVDGVLLDATTAHLLVQVHDALQKPENRERFLNMPINTAANFAFRLTTKR